MKNTTQTTKETYFGIERRGARRFPFSADVMISGPGDEVRVSGRVIEISMNGCYVEAHETFPPGELIRLTIERSGGSRRFTTWASVVHCQPGRGMGLALISPEPDQAAVLSRWLAELATSSK